MTNRKTCVHEGCRYPIFAKGYCKYHQGYRTDPKRPRKISIKRRVTGEKALFDQIWAKRMHVSYLSGKSLEQYCPYFYLNMFAHLISKRKAKELMLVEKNIVLLTPDEHYLLDFGTKEMRERYAERNGCDWGRLEKLKQELLDIEKSVLLEGK